MVGSHFEVEQSKEVEDAAQNDEMHAKEKNPGIATDENNSTDTDTDTRRCRRMRMQIF